MLAASGGMLLSSPIALAEPPAVAVEVVVEAVPRSITVTGAPSVSVLAGSEATEGASVDATTLLSFSNPIGNGPARTEISRDGADLGALRLFAAPPVDEAYDRGVAEWFGTSTFTWAFALGIGEDVMREDLPISVWLTGETGPPRSFMTTLTFAILDN